MRILNFSLKRFCAVVLWLLLASNLHLSSVQYNLHLSSVPNNDIKPKELAIDALYSKYMQKSLTTKIHFTTFAHASLASHASLNSKALISHPLNEGQTLNEGQENLPYAFMSEAAVIVLLRMKQERPYSFEDIALDKPIKGHINDNLWGRAFEKSLYPLNGRGLEFGYRRSMLFDESEELAEETVIGHFIKGSSVFAKASANFGATLQRDEAMMKGVIKLFNDTEKRTVDAKITVPALQVTLDSPAHDLKITAADYKRSEKCLADAIYFESRSEPERGQVAVAQVIVNRALSGYYPNSICGVVYQNSHKYLACQFTFSCEGKKLIVTEKEHWSRAIRIAKDILAGKIWLKDVANATHYHASYVAPYWAKSMKKHQKIGLHHFYRPREWN